MNIEQTILLSLLNKPEKPPEVDTWTPLGIPISGTTECEVLLYLNYRRPPVYNGHKMEYFKEEPDTNGDYVMGMGLTIESTMENHLKSNPKVEFIGSQFNVRDLDDKWRGKLDFAVNIQGLGNGIIDCKGMSESVFKGFLNTPLKEFKLPYYVQIVSYIHILNVDWGAIAGVNRNNGDRHVQLVKRDETKEDFNYWRNRTWKIINAKSPRELTKSTDRCQFCKYNNVCNSNS